MRFQGTKWFQKAIAQEHWRRRDCWPPVWQRANLKVLSWPTKYIFFCENGCRLLPQVRRRDFLQTPLLHLNHRWSQTRSLFRYKRHANLCFRFPDDVSFDALLVFSSFLKQCPTANMNDWLNPNSWNTFFLPIHLERKDTNNVTTALRKSGSKIYFDFVHPVPLYFFFFIFWTNVTNSHHSSNAIFFGPTEWKEKRQR